MAGFAPRQGSPVALPPRRDYLRAREISDPDKAAAAAVRVLSDWQVQRIKLALGHEFKITSRVILRRPLWMPNALFMWLLRCIVIERQEIEEKHK